MKTSPRGILELCEHEGIVPAPYLDSVGVWTWGVGHTAAAGGPDPKEMNRAMPSTDAEIQDGLIRAIQQLDVDLKTYEDAVNQAVRVPLEQHEFDALVSFHFNTGGIHRAKLTKELNAGRPDAARHFMGWLKPPEIRGRRTAEMQLFKTGDYDANGDAIPVWGTNGTGKLTKPIRTVNGSWVLEVMGRDAPPPKPVKIPPEATKVIQDADKSPAASTTALATILAAATGAWQWWQAADWQSQALAAVVAVVALYIFKERLRKAKLGRLAKEALGQ